MGDAYGPRLADQGPTTWLHSTFAVEQLTCRSEMHGYVAKRR